MTQKAAGGSNALQDKSFFLTDSYTQSATTNSNKHIHKCVKCCVASHPFKPINTARCPSETCRARHTQHACMCWSPTHAGRKSCSRPAIEQCAGATLQESTTTLLAPTTFQKEKTNRTAPKDRYPVHCVRQRTCTACTATSRQMARSHDKGIAWRSTTPGGVVLRSGIPTPRLAPAHS